MWVLRNYQSNSGSATSKLKLWFTDQQSVFITLVVVTSQPLHKIKKINVRKVTEPGFPIQPSHSKPAETKK